ncbi:hypothetical protein [Streptomyces sp. NRRL S-1022]|uniref:hypothetical protein n=1 Tax=Streptomyces sp. NRRL S-1022 TaxID=1463880 RepID=UPI00131C9D80|nr:hypothetical protein [Streptomyces sp. NRRL S-1022]
MALRVGAFEATGLVPGAEVLAEAAGGAVAVADVLPGDGAAGPGQGAFPVVLPAVAAQGAAEGAALSGAGAAGGVAGQVPPAFEGDDREPGAGQAGGVGRRPGDQGDVAAADVEPVPGARALESGHVLPVPCHVGAQADDVEGAQRELSAAGRFGGPADAGGLPDDLREVHLPGRVAVAGLGVADQSPGDRAGAERAENRHPSE